jgi:peptidoglycan/xylan/chitin deacetylase (PgdA/CDA1 family)
MVRFDRLATLYFSMPLRGCARGEQASRLPVLMYHSVSDDFEEGVGPYYRLVTSSNRFAEQMQWMSDLGYKGLPLEEALPWREHGKERITRPVSITFDDGFRDFYTAAWPLLRRHGFTATMYLPTGFVSNKRKSFRDKECLTWDEVRELRRQGIRFGSHTVTHPKLYELPWEKIESELVISKDQLQEELQEEVTSFAYPYAFPQEDASFRQGFAALLQKTGYRHCATTVIGCVRPGDDSYCIKRLPANSCDDKALFTAKLAGAYDWLNIVQRVYRLTKRRHFRSGAN